MGQSRQIQSSATVGKGETANVSTIDSTADTIRFAQWIQSDEGDDVVLALESGTWGLRPRCYAQTGERIGQGQRCGHLRFGARVNVLVPESTRINVEIGDKVRAGTSIIATLVRKVNESLAVTSE
jgi:phosphatidylserine decarboxylase